MDVPARIATLPQWVLWRYVGADRRKVPFRFDGQPAKSNDSTTWGPLPASVPAGYDGLGFVFRKDGGIFGIDLDGCLGDDQVIQPWAVEILTAMPTYAEYSPSGHGVKLWGLGTIPGGTGRKQELDHPKVCDRNPSVELYGKGRYFTFTGQRCSEAVDLVDCQAALEALYARFWGPAAPKSTNHRPASPGPQNAVQRAQAYLLRVPPAISGQGGHDQTFRAACILVLGFNLPPETAYPLLAAWNLTCQPPWTEKELRHKLADADKKAGPRGWILEERGYEGPDVELCGLLGDDFATPQKGDVELVPEFPQECLVEMPALMRLAYDYTIATAIKPQPELTLAALIAFFGAVFGRRVKDDYTTRSNIMTLGLAPSGAGKEHPRQIVKRLLDQADLLAISGPERIGSHAGIVSSVAQHPVRLFQLDEIGRLLATMKNPEKAPHLYNVGTVLMQLYSSANTVWTGDAYADLNKVKRINQPCVCVFGTAVPDGFYHGLTPDNLKDGLLGRLLVLESKGYGGRQKPVDCDPPTELLDGLRQWRNVGVGKGNLPDVPDPICVAKTDESNQLHEDYCNAVHAKHSKEDDVFAAVWARAPEKAAKLALIYACCAVREWPPVITLDAVLWAKRLVNYSTRLMLSSATNSVSRNRYEEEKKRLWRIVKTGMPLKEVAHRTPWLRKRERSEILSDLQEDGAIELVEIPTKGRPRTEVKKARQTL